MVAGFPINNGLLPVSKGPGALPYLLDFTSVNSIVINPFAEIASQQIDFFQTVYIDNSQNGEALTLTVSLTSQRIICPAYGQGVFPIFHSDAALIVMSKPSVGGNAIVIFLSVPIPPFSWSVQQSAGVLPAALTGGTFTVTTGTITTGGTAQQILAANASRKRLVIVAPDNNTEPLYWRFGANTGLPNAGIVLYPGGSYVTPGGQSESPQSIFAIAATTGTRWTTWEM